MGVPKKKENKRTAGDTKRQGQAPHGHQIRAHPSTKNPPETTTPKKPEPAPIKTGIKRLRQETANTSNPSSNQPAAKKPRNSSPPPANTHSLPTTLPANATNYISDTSGLLTSLMESYTVATLNIISSTKIQAKVARTLDTVLKRFSFTGPAKPNIVMLYAKAPVASKMITIIEIVKREVESAGGKWYQYNRLDTEVNVYSRKAAGAKTGNEVVDGNMEVDVEKNGGESSDEEPAFETMKTTVEKVTGEGSKSRVMPVMCIYLSRVRIEKLKAAYGYVLPFFLLLYPANRKLESKLMHNSTFRGQTYMFLSQEFQRGLEVMAQRHKIPICSYI
jgi:hypothetical protein